MTIYFKLHYEIRKSVAKYGSDFWGDDAADNYGFGSSEVEGDFISTACKEHSGCLLCRCRLDKAEKCLPELNCVYRLLGRRYNVDVDRQRSHSCNCYVD